MEKLCEGDFGVWAMSLDAGLRDGCSGCGLIELFGGSWAVVGRRAWTLILAAVGGGD